MEKKEKDERSNDPKVKEITITTRGSKKPFVFVSYASDDWRMVLHEIVYRLNQVYGLRVYFDRDFDVHNENWTKQFPYNMRSPFCKAILVFYSDRYRRRYATLMELMCSKTKRANDIPLIPVNLGNLKPLTDYEKEDITGLGKEDWNGNTNHHAKEELELFNKLYDELIVTKKYSGIKPLYDKIDYDDDNGFRVSQCSDMIGTLYAASHVQENLINLLGEDLDAEEYQAYLESDKYQEDLDDANYQKDIEDLCRIVAEKIHNKVDKDKKDDEWVFDKDKYEYAMGLKKAPAKQSETETSPTDDKSPRTDVSAADQQTASAAPKKPLISSEVEQKESSAKPKKSLAGAAAEQRESSAAPEEILTFREAKAVRTENGIRILKESIVNKKINEKTIRKEAKKKRLPGVAWYHCTSRGANGIIAEINDEKYMVLRGSRRAPEAAASYQERVRLKDFLQENVKEDLFLKDSEELAISSAAAILSLQSTNGKQETSKEVREEEAIRILSENLGAQIPCINAGLQAEQASAPSDKTKASGNSGASAKLPGVAWFHCKARGANGVLAKTEDDQYLVLRGSCRAPEPAPRYEPSKLMKEFEEKVLHDIFTVDTTPTSLTGAARMLSLKFTTDGKQETQNPITMEAAQEILRENLEKVKAPVTIPELPSEDLKVGEFVKMAMDNLQKSGYEFSKEQLDELTDLERSKKIFGLKSGITFLKKYDRKEDKPHCDNTGRPRYYSPDSRGNKDGFVLKFGGEEYLLTSQWYDGQQAAFREWYKSLGKH